MKTVCQPNQCAGCHACSAICNKGAIQINDAFSAYNAVIDEVLCIDCGLCKKVCPVNHPVAKRTPLQWQQGWSNDTKLREQASSGGLASAIHRAFVENGGIVCSCVFDRGNFIFDFASTLEETKKFVGSKYVKSNPQSAYQRINALLKQNTKVLFLGLPCQCAAVKRYTENHELLYTVDLICHGTPSPKCVQMFLAEKGHDISQMKDVKFRNKTSFYLADDKKSIEVSPAVRDRYTLAFLDALCYTENCYSCYYADTARVSDLTLGDSWGSSLTEEEQKKGISLALSQTEKGNHLLAIADIHLEPVDSERAIANNRQLKAPSTKSSKSEFFFAVLSKKKNFSKAVKKCYPKTCFRQAVKACLYQFKRK